MEFVINLVAEYSGIVAPGVAVWATLMLHMQPKNINSSMVQIVYFFSLLFVALLTVRATLNHDPMWLISASSLGVLIVAGALKRPVEEFDAIILNSRVG